MNFSKGDRVRVVDAPGYEDFEGYYMVHMNDRAVVLDYDEDILVVPLDSLEKI